jgi:hypothetical protein
MARVKVITQKRRDAKRRAAPALEIKRVLVGGNVVGFAQSKKK